MADYKEMYLTLFRATEQALRRMEEAERLLTEAQNRCEELYMDADETVLSFPAPPRD